jgi:hypothetical protein
MAVRAASWAFLALLLAVDASAAERPAAPPASADSFPVATDVRLGGDEAQTRFVMDFSRKIELHAFTLADPYRVVIDIPQVIFQLPPKAGETGRGLIKAFRFGLVMQGGSRLVFDLAKPARIEKAFVVDPTDSAPARLVLDLAQTDREAFLHKVAIDSRAARADLPRADGPESKGSDSRPLVVLDPGHGGIDIGTKGPGGEEEKDIVLNFAQRLRLNSCRLTAARRGRRAGREHLYPVRYGDRFRGGTARRKGKPRRRHRRRRPEKRARRCRRHPDRPCRARDQEFFGAVGPQAARRDEGGHAPA